MQMIKVQQMQMERLWRLTSEREEVALRIFAAKAGLLGYSGLRLSTKAGGLYARLESIGVQSKTENQCRSSGVIDT
jgi:hypothetical protein